MPESTPSFGGWSADRPRSVKRRETMVGPLNRKSQPLRPQSWGATSWGATRRSAVGLILGAPLLGACASVQQSFSQFSNPFASPQPQPGPAGPQQHALSVGTGQVKVG